VAIGIMEFEFMGGSMGSVVGEKITRLIEYATNQRLPLIIVCASGGARMQEGSLSLMQMAKISSALHEYQTNQKLFYVPILTSPTTGGVTASFGMLGDISIVEPDATIAFAGWRNAQQIRQLANIAQTGHQQTDWTKPSHGRYKCNVDVSFSLNRNKVGIGMCIRDDHGRFVDARIEWIELILDVKIGEAIGLMHALKWLKMRYSYVVMRP
ncbi:acetyl-CoA carboxylase carboxyltransferase beta subunit, partial [Trifolium pratense]